MEIIQIECERLLHRELQDAFLAAYLLSICADRNNPIYLGWDILLNNHSNGDVITACVDTFVVWRFDSKLRNFDPICVDPHVISSYNNRGNQFFWHFFFSRSTGWSWCLAWSL